MNITTIILSISGLAGIFLSLFGLYTIVDEFIQPSGYAFEGVVLFSFGLIMILMVTIGLAIGKAMISFADILQKQTEIQNKLNQNNSNIKGMPFTSMLTDLMKNPQNGISIEFTPLSGINSIKSSIENHTSSYDYKPKESTYKYMSLEQLESELEDAIKKEKFEDAEKINKLINKMKNNNSDNELSDDNPNE